MTTKIDSQPARGMERRSFRLETRQVDEQERSAWVTAVVYDVVDDYGTVWQAGCFRESLENKLPKATWSHNWSDIIGRVTEYQDSDTRLDVKIQFSDFDAVPRAKQAWSQMKSGDVDEMSFGFERQEFAVIEEGDGAERMLKARMYEVSPVLVGAVPDTAVLSVRSKPEIREAVEALKEASENLSKLLAETREEEPQEKPATSTTTITTVGDISEVVVESQELEPGDLGKEEEPTPEEVKAEAQAIEQLLTEALEAEALAVKVLVS